MDLKNRLIKPSENSTTRFEPFYQITPKELDEICKEYHAEQLRIGGVSNSFCELFVPREKKSSYCAKCAQHKIDH